ncbi:MAG: M15 family metallopeptidase [Dysgonomonas sp.]
MNKIILFFSLSFCLGFSLSAQESVNIKKLKLAYPDFVKSFDGTYILLNNGKKIIYDDRKNNKTNDELLNDPSVADMFRYLYVKGKTTAPAEYEDPGRIRNENFMKAMYGSTSSEVQKNLTTIVWCPNLVNAKIKITTINGVDRQLKKISDELDKHPELKKYLEGATTFNWRIIAGTKRLSTHSFGTSIDLNVKYSNYWQWDCNCKKENVKLSYKNRIPQEIIAIFEKYGFIWGGKWYHYDTMHFEYRPELLIE